MQSFVQSALPDPVSVCGINLLPLSIGHVIILERFGAAEWWDGSKPPTLESLLFGLFVCSRTWDEFTREFYGGRMSFDETADKITASNFSKEAEVFSAYITEGISGPTFEFEDKEGASLGSHWVEILRVNMMRLGVVGVDLMNTPIALALHDVTTRRELDGALRVISESELEERNERRRLANEIEKQHTKGFAC